MRLALTALAAACTLRLCSALTTFPPGLALQTVSPIQFWCLRDLQGNNARCAVEAKDPDHNHRTFVFSDCGGGGNPGGDGHFVKIRFRQLSFGEGGYGATVWYSGISLATWVVQRRHLFQGKRVLELGSGCGLTGLACAGAGAASVTLTDFGCADPEERRRRSTFAPLRALENLGYNVALNSFTPEAHPGPAGSSGSGEAAGVKADPGAGGRCHVQSLDWHDCVKPGYSPSGGDVYETVLAADCLYDEKDVIPLAAAVRAHLAPGGTAHFMSPADRKGVKNSTLRALLMEILAGEGCSSGGSSADGDCGGDGDGGDGRRWWEGPGGRVDEETMVSMGFSRERIVYSAFTSAGGTAAADVGQLDRTELLS